MPSIMLPDIDCLSLSEQVSQMVVVRACGMLYDHQIQYPQWELTKTNLHKLISDYGVGGVILLGGSAAEIALRTQEMQSWAKIPLLMAADIEEGVGQRFDGATWFPPPMALQDVALKYAEEMGRITAQEALAIGINWVLAPVVDVNNNPENPVINVRAFGITPGEVMGTTRAFIAGAKQYPVLTTAKHFPGHGDTAIDSHLQTPTLPHDRDRFNNVEFPPFQNAIAAGIDAIMTAHVFAPQLDPQNIATLSSCVLTDILRHELGFEGLISTDALIMSGVAKLDSPEAIAVQAVKAGADILLMPINPIATIEAVCAAVEAGEIAHDRIKASVQRIWNAKQKVCGHAPNLMELGNPQNLQIAKEIATKSISVYTSVEHHRSHRVDDDQDDMRMPAADHLLLPRLNLLIVDDPLTCHEFLTARSPAVVFPKQQEYVRLVADQFTLENLGNQLTSQYFSSIFIQIFNRGNPFRGNININNQIAVLLEKLIKEQLLSAIVVYGSPYCLDQFLALLPSNIAWGFSYSQQPEAQETLLKQLGF